MLGKSQGDERIVRFGITVENTIHGEAKCRINQLQIEFEIATIQLIRNVRATLANCLPWEATLGLELRAAISPMARRRTAFRNPAQVLQCGMGAHLLPRAKVLRADMLRRYSSSRIKKRTKRLQIHVTDLPRQFLRVGVQRYPTPDRFPPKKQCHDGEGYQNE